MLLDTYAWIEFFQGSEKGKKVENILKREKCYTGIVSLAEVIEWCLKNDFNPKKFLDIINKGSIVIGLNESIVLLAGEINFQNKKRISNWGMIDSLIYATTLFYELKVITGDKHFQDLANVVFL